MNVAGIFSEAKSGYEGQELTSSDVVIAAKEIEKLAVSSFLGRQRLIEVALREWMLVNRKGTSTTRQDFEKAVRWYLEGRWELP